MYTLCDQKHLFCILLVIKLLPKPCISSACSGSVCGHLAQNYYGTHVLVGVEKLTQHFSMKCTCKLSTFSEMHFVHYCAFLSLCHNMHHTMVLTSKCVQTVLKSCTNVTKQETLVHPKNKML